MSHTYKIRAYDTLADQILSYTPDLTVFLHPSTEDMLTYCSMRDETKKEKVLFIRWQKYDSRTVHTQFICRYSIFATLFLGAKLSILP